jgi:hypothetical protein
LLKDPASNYTYIYAMNPGPNLSKDKLSSLCTETGEVTGIEVLSDCGGKPVGLSFVSFESTEAAKQVSVTRLT